ncbi:hypothetical protein BIW11_09340 [Tropilaelaps mercedesae]|uniref:PIN domain-containing protein n=1 Tax=Tropilaelaps mercedesae TaxID=418985 RepID=A0A1V9XKM8_9ACAR|nr:hypothetical protein BIW11_09340 [Tropilaelaps mercedesae]
MCGSGAPLTMDRLTPAQQAVLERMQKKKELQAKKAAKRKSKKASTSSSPSSVKDPAEMTSQCGQGDTVSTNDIGMTKSSSRSVRADSARPCADASGDMSVVVESKQSARAGRSRKTEVNIVDTEESNDEQQKSVELAESRDSLPTTPRSTRSRKTDVLPDKNHLIEEVSDSTEAGKTPKAARGRKTISSLEKPEMQEQVMTPAQLQVLEKIRSKKNDNPKKRKSVKDPNLLDLKTGTDTEPDSDIPMSSTMIEAPIKGRRKNVNADVSVVDPVSIDKGHAANVGGSPNDKKKPPEMIGLDESDGEPEPDPGVSMNVTQLAVMELIKKKKAAKEALASKSVKSRKSLMADTSIMDSCPEKPTQPAKIDTVGNSDTKPKRESMTPNQMAVLKRLQSKQGQQSQTTPVKPSFSARVNDEGESSDDSCSEGSTGGAASTVGIRATSSVDDTDFKELKEFLDMLERGNRRASYRLTLRKLVAAGVEEAMKKSQPLTKNQKDLVEFCRNEIMDKGGLQPADSADLETSRSKKPVRESRANEVAVPTAGIKRKNDSSCIGKATIQEDDEDMETDSTEDTLIVKKRPRREQNVKSPKSPELTSDDENMKCETVSTKQPAQKTFLIFDTNVYLHIYPYCKAVLECDKAQADEDFEDIIMFAIFVVVRELDKISKKTGYIRQTAVNAIRLIHTALQDDNPRIEGQDLSSSRERLQGSTLNDDYILKSAEILNKRGDSVIVVTDDTNLQVKIAMMKLPALGLIEFISRFHWLTPIVTANLGTDMKLLGEDAIAMFAETVVTSIVLKAVMAQLSSMPAAERRNLFPSKRLAPTLAYMLKYKRLLEQQGEPLASLNYDRVGTTLHALQKYREDPKSLDRLKHFARFITSAAILTRSLADFFPNMRTRADLVAAISNVYQHHLSSEERVHLSTTESQQRRPRLEKQCLLSSSAPHTGATASVQGQTYSQRAIPSGRKTLLPNPPKAPMASRNVSSAATRHSQSAFHTAPPVDSNTRSSRPATVAAPQPRSVRQGPTVRDQDAASIGEGIEPVYFSFSEGQKQPPEVSPVVHHSTLKPAFTSPSRYVIGGSSTKQTSPTQPHTPGDTLAKAGLTNPYAGCQKLISYDVIQTVYNYFQQFGTSVCNYTGSCCVKMGVRFSLAFAASGAQLEPSLPDVTEAFGLVLQSMKKLITEVGATVENAEAFLNHSTEVMRLISKVDPQLASALPDISAHGLLQFVNDSDGKLNLAAGYKQFCDFNNCLEKCWLDLQGSNGRKLMFS